jgi:hypothetical protein
MEKEPLQSRTEADVPSDSVQSAGAAAFSGNETADIKSSVSEIEKKPVFKPEPPGDTDIKDSLELSSDKKTSVSEYLSKQADSSSLNNDGKPHPGQQSEEESGTSLFDTETTKIFILKNPKTPVAPEEKFTPESLWHALIKDMENCNQPLLRDYMAEGRPVSLDNNVLTVVYDGDTSDFSVNEIEKEIKFIETRLKEVGASKNLSIKIERTKEVTSPHSVHHPRLKDLSEVKEKVEKNKFVQDTLDLFDGSIVDVKG